MKRLMHLIPLALVLITPLNEAEARKRREESLLSMAADGITDALVPAPADEEVCFSPDEHCDVKLAKFVKSAQQSIDIAIFDITLDQFVHQVLVQSKKLPVRIVVDRRQAKGKHSLVPLLVKAGANVRYGHQRGIMHNKFTIVDGKMLETGSFNYTNNASKSNNENQLYLANPKIVNRYKKRFEQIWAEADPVD